MPSTTIQIEIEIRDQLRALGRMGESYNDVIKRLLQASHHLEAFRSGGRGILSQAQGPVWIPLRDKQ